jgi:hypothetical protein
MLQRKVIPDSMRCEYLYYMTLNMLVTTNGCNASTTSFMVSPGFERTIHRDFLFPNDKPDVLVSDLYVP